MIRICDLFFIIICKLNKDCEISAHKVFNIWFLIPLFEMGRGKRLTNEELAVIKAYKDKGLSNREIAKKIKRSPKVVNNYFKIGVNYGAYKGSGG